VYVATQQAASSLAFCPGLKLEGNKAKDESSSSDPPSPTGEEGRAATLLPCGRRRRRRRRRKKEMKFRITTGRQS